MRVAIVGTAGDIRGFVLAGLDPMVCDDERTAAGALEQLERDPDVGVIVITPAASRLAPQHLLRLRARAAPPIPCVLEPAEPLTS